MRALLLAAGRGTRLRPLTDTVPKCLVAVHGRPLIDYWLDLLFEAGIERALINTHWLAEQVRDHLAHSRWAARVDLVHEREVLGTGGTLLANRTYFGKEPVLVAHADNLTDFDVTGFISAHARRPSQCVMTMLAFRTDEPPSCGILECDRQDIVVAFHEKVIDPPGNLANGAVYLMEPRLIEEIAQLDRACVDLSLDVIPVLMKRIFVFKTTGYHRDIGSAASLQRAHSEFRPKPRPARGRAARSGSLIGFRKASLGNDWQS
jgi:mannose-1-phosphate guanylyltransferase